jgi:hypothetical protein
VALIERVRRDLSRQRDGLSKVTARPESSPPA